MDEEPRIKLGELIDEYGFSLCQDAKRCEGLLRDVCGEQRREINVLVSAVREGVVAELLASLSTSQPEMLLSRLTRKLEDNCGLAEESARWSVASWAYALGIVSVDKADSLSKPSALSRQSSASIINAQPPSNSDYSRRSQSNKTGSSACLVELSGESGQQVTEQFKLQNGLTVFEMTMTGADEYFGITLLDTDGEYVDGLVNETGDYYGVKAVKLDDSYTGQYILDVDAGGDWNIKISQPHPTRAEGKPQTFTGKGQKVTPFVHLNKGLSIFRLKHDGESNFSPTLLDANGEYIEGLTNKVGKVSASKAVKIEDVGLYVIDVCADGDWMITVE